MDASALSESSRTAPFTVRHGDTVSFYRELGWYNPLIEQQDPDNYYALDSLDYAVELVDAANGERLALLDSIGVLRRDTPGYPSLHGTRPIIAHVKYRIPSSLDGDTAFLRVRLYVRGDGPHHMLRRDDLTVKPYLRLNDSLWLDYINEYGGSLARKSVRELLLTARATSGSKPLMISPNPTTGRTQISYQSPDDEKRTAVVIYDMNGEAIFTPVLGMRPRGLNVSSFSFDRNGTYFVALYSGEELIASTKVTVKK